MAEAPESERPKTKGKGLLIGAVAAALLGAGGFYAVWSGLILGAPAGETEIHDEAEDQDGSHEAVNVAALAAVEFVPVDPLVVSLTGPNVSRHLRFRAELEVATEHRPEVEHLMPRVVDVMNGYLRAIDPNSLGTTGALVSLRAQLLRRVALVVGPEKVRDVLVMEFVLS